MLPSIRPRGVAAAHSLLLLLAVTSSLVSLPTAARPMPDQWQPGRRLAATPSAAAHYTLPPRQPAELSNSFIAVTIQDLEPQLFGGVLQTPCEYAVQRARSIGGKYFSVAVTAHWLGGPNSVDGYAYKSVDEAGVQYLPASQETIRRWKQGMQVCIRAAVTAGFSGVQILNHIDQAAPGPAWRNLLVFDPLEAHQGFSYEDVVVRPAADALRTVTRPSTKVWFMLGGEMGRSMWTYPRSYLTLLEKYKARLDRGRAGGNVKVGIALHWNKVCGNCFDVPNSATAAEYNASYAQAFANSKAAIESQFSLPDVRRLFKASEVVGVSDYTPMPQRMTQDSFELPFTTCAYELSFFGIDLGQLAASHATDFVFSEIGLGGGASDGRSTATDLQSLTQYVERGIWANYNVAQDPWARPDYRAYRRSWHANLLGFLRSGGGPHVKVDAAFAWSVGSFDVAAVHPVSTSAEGSYADPEIVGWMSRLSAQVV